jgi:hypothetical protein
MDDTRNDARPAGEAAAAEWTNTADPAHRPGGTEPGPGSDGPDAQSKARRSRPEPPALVESTIEPAVRETL